MLVALIALLCIFATRGLCVCYFPVEFQGMFSTQSTLTGQQPHKYSEIIILPDGIPVWGVCHTRNESDVILHDATGGQDCFRCFHISLHLPNVIQIYTEGLDKCYMHEKAALATCPTENDIRSHRAREIMLYKSRSFTREGAIDRVVCPFSGNYHFTYDVNDGGENSMECSNPSSTLSTCPRSSEMELRFRGCKFSDSEMKLQCLGDWSGINGFRYFALWDTSVTSNDQPHYRCAMYYKDKDSGDIYLSFSIDSTCTNHLLSPWDGYEQMILSPSRFPHLPSIVHSHRCIFPQWSHGLWQSIQIAGRDMRWNDGQSDKVYEFLCLSHYPNSDGERFALLRRDQCGEIKYSCVWIKQRDINVLEFKIGSVEQTTFNSSKACIDEYFTGQKWHTQGRRSFSEETRCPVSGFYVGVIPDDTELCAKLASDCEHPQRMHYTVSSCKNQSQAFEEREYQCLGQWEEAGIMYTFTYRIDVDTYECFAGVMVSENEAFIIEAGTNCKRGLQPLSKGMKLIRQATCKEDALNDEGTQTRSPSLEEEGNYNRPTPSSWWPPHSSSRKPWSANDHVNSQPPWMPYDSVAENSTPRRSLPTYLLFIFCILFNLSQR